MKKTLIIAMVLLIVACESQEPLKLSYSSEFKYVLPSSFNSGATVFFAEEMGAKASNGEVFSGLTVTSENEKLPEGFDVTTYPEFVLKLKSTAALSEDIAKLFESESLEINREYGLSNLKVTKTASKTIYTLCKKDDCLAIVVKRDYKDHIFYGRTQKIDRTKLINLLKGN